MMTKCGSGLVRCNLCGQELRCSKGGTSNLLRHMKTKHVDVSSRSNSGSQGESSTLSTSTELGKSQPSAAVPQSSGMTQQTMSSALNRLTKYRSDSQRKKDLDEKLLAMVYTDMQPLSIVDDIGFKNFCHELDQRYELPSRRRLKRSLHQVYEEEKTLLVEALLKVDSIGISTDSWTSVNMESFLTITAHFLEPLPSWNMQNVVLATRLIDKSHEGSSAQGMAGFINEVLEEFQIKEKLVEVTTDNASSIVNVVKNHIKVIHVRCFAHTLNLIVKNAIKASAELKFLVEAVKKIVNLFHRSAKAAARLKTTIADLGCAQLKLCQDVETRWNSTLKMLRRYCDLHRPVTGSLMALGKVELIISDHNVEQIKLFCECLEPFDEAIEMMSTEKTTSLSKKLVVVRQLKSFLTTETRNCELNNLLIKSLRGCFPHPEQNFHEAAATLLDPRFKRVPFANHQLRIQHEERIIDTMESLLIASRESSVEAQTPVSTEPPAKKQKSFMRSFMDKVKEQDESKPSSMTGPRAEIEKFMEMKFLDFAGDPLKWWQEHTVLFPHLSMVARKHAFIPATSVPSERLFSKAGELFSKKRSCLKESTVDMILFLHNMPKFM